MDSPLYRFLRHAPPARDGRGGSRDEIRTIQKLLGHKDVASTMIYTHVLNRPGLHVRSPLD